ncbi:cystathionine gamma-lyase [Babesia caballi]|uniref:Cystathionine gamma-lyase n=1 Tax=Babesia caballi TaxID=5871 RepID=A0AAV4M1M0_BABCB|nr:cystathionine gamma-lyase [Babesia caballi]
MCVIRCHGMICRHWLTSAKLICCTGASCGNTQLQSGSGDEAVRQRAVVPINIMVTFTLQRSLAQHVALLYIESSALNQAVALSLASARQAVK